MIHINNQQIFDKTVSDAIEAAVSNSGDEQTAGRWTRAIDRAVTEISENPFLDYDEATHQLLICSPSNNIYSANDVCQCKAYAEFHVPCWHRAAARIVRLYFEALNTPPITKAAAALISAREMDSAIYRAPARVGANNPKVGGFRL